jgi:hypothetical protein
MRWVRWQFNLIARIKDIKAHKNCRTIEESDFSTCIIPTQHDPSHRTVHGCFMRMVCE